MKGKNDRRLASNPRKGLVLRLTRVTTSALDSCLQMPVSVEKKAWCAASPWHWQIQALDPRRRLRFGRT